MSGKSRHTIDKAKEAEAAIQQSFELQKEEIDESCPTLLSESFRAME